MATKDKVSYARKWRKDRRENRRLEISTMEYLRCKYPAIRAEIEELFTQINTKHSRKNNLTKTAEFTVWKTNVMFSSSQQPAPVMSSSSQEPVSVIPSSTQESAPVMPSSGQDSAPVMPSSSQDSVTVTTTTTVMASSQELQSLCDFDLGNEDPLLCGLDSTEMSNLIQELSNDPDLQDIMDTYCT